MTRVGSGFINQSSTWTVSVSWELSRWTVTDWSVDIVLNSLWFRSRRSGCLAQWVGGDESVSGGEREVIRVRVWWVKINFLHPIENPFLFFLGFKYVLIEWQLKLSGWFELVQSSWVGILWIDGILYVLISFEVWIGLTKF